ncbi:phosphate ABC transporter substrate-binding protein, PhoT family [Variovorax sp. OK605]|uniref:substrate-binding domain-containing protein n=1 Tax=unclassified Variovorax TaxID=663243 RepID=UPI0008D233A7|nr:MULTISPECIES: substrate-binding domain-containing protein [unclassified Variovorax]SEK14807.1 phosphate ABC transporter substrate-binding protein, PhoT family [Variovorax sp. OK202]SFE04194.1 phosphate ABC transporter substrate-binding protein, PhoT family [Variovorax sp. OK212]SFQ73052.1 phosphate ABC transporter substrate-binding protein, PhoT family [Variovorax sp. OK605]
MRSNFKTVALSTMMMACLMAAGAASAQIAVGGGATLPEPLYKDLLPSGVGSTNYTYTGTGSGAGKKAFLQNNAQATVGSEFRNESLAARPIWATTQSVHFAGSDSVLTAAERDAYKLAHIESSPGVPVTGAAAWGPLIQIPAVGAAVLIPYKSSTTSAISSLNLPDAKMCAVFSKTSGGRTWGELLGTTDTTPIQVVYRNETSGTTELLARYLMAACPTSGFVFSNNFRTVVAGALPAGTPQPRLSTAPADPAADAIWTFVDGNGVMATSFTTAGRIGYLSPDVAFNPTNATLVATVNGFAPVASSIKTALASQTLPLGGASTDPLAWVPAYVKPPVSGTGASYPIFGTTNLLVNQCYKDPAITTKVRNFLARLYVPSPLVASHGFVALPDGTGVAGSNANWKSAIQTTFLSTTAALGIGNTNVCNGIGRPVSN